MFSLGCHGADDEQRNLRINPTIEATDTAVFDYTAYPFLNLDANTICMNGDDWSELAEKFRAAKEGRGLFSVVYLGDSHIQADFGGSVLRDRLAAASHDAGRGLIIPFKLAGTNEPLDYKLTFAKGTYASSRLLKKPWLTDMPFTGIGICPTCDSCTMEISCESRPFDRLRIFFSGDAPEISGIAADSCAVAADISTDCTGVVTVTTDTPVPAARLHIRGNRNTLAGIELLSDTVGSLVHSIGNNGATYSTYNEIGGFAGELAKLNPDLIVVALGTNEAFGKADAETVASDMRTLIDSIRAEMPKAKLLVVTPTECFRKVYRRGKGKRRRVASTVVNNKTGVIASTVADEARKAGIPLYDHYAVAGGSGAASRMQAKGVLGKDGVHFTAEGYRLWGHLLADAILAAMNCHVACEEKNAGEQKNN